ncbi:hypothetical protein O53_1437 [Microcystis aeruginosa TAIHU98]|uniref:Uncharacterized protein n=1 Tax=Microcystis aeruginosa TAIHU98 TaxID=1134457 RepID=L7EEV9_MICAE|nr:hypothetical protein O53_1437 [Microcystis aeruginosa TAIHU98]
MSKPLYLGFAAKSLLVGLGVSSRPSGVGSREFQALLPCFFVPVYLLKKE